MINKKDLLFKTMYTILDQAWDLNHEENLGNYLSDANPNLCDGESADPVVYKDFCKKYDDCKNKNMDDYEFIIYYLVNVDKYYGDIKKHFKITKKDFENKLLELTNKIH